MIVVWLVCVRLGESMVFVLRVSVGLMFLGMAQGGATFFRLKARSLVFGVQGLMAWLVGDSIWVCLGVILFRCVYVFG